ncbi:hypothetical protein AB0F25_17310 [Streptomyces wedmorensis]|uniref:hypothetical protein n=1 Tax=Streptomyces wedmorensis TaxID=43759 RepID=UPI00343CC4A1
MSGREPSARRHISAEGGFAYAVVDGDIHVYVDGLPVYVLENWRPTPEADPEWLRELPSRMLSARHEIVPFTGRDEELADLRAWRDSARRLAVRWLQGPGGQGKSRLAAAFAREAVADGWKAVRAVHGAGNVLASPATDEGVDLRTGGAPGLLLVIDYADHRPFPHLTWLLSNRLLHRPALPTRVLMPARSSDMWPAVQAALSDVQAATSLQILGLLPGGDGKGPRAEMFRVARDAFAAVHEPANGPAFAARVLPPMPLEGGDFGLTLSVHMAALVAVDALARGEPPPTDAAFLVTYLLNRERSRWARLHTQDAGRRAAAVGRVWTTSPEVMNRTVFTAALTGPVPRQPALDVVGRVIANDPAVGHSAERIVADHAAVLRQCGRDIEALRAQTEALELVTELVREHPGSYEDTLGLRFLDVGVTLTAALREPAALAATHAAVLLLDREARDGSATREGPLSTALTNLARLLLTQGPALRTGIDWRERALEATARAVDINRLRAKANPFPLVEDLVQSLRIHAAALEAAHRPSAARAVREEVDQLSYAPAASSRRGHFPSVTYDRKETEEVVDALELTVFRHMARHDVRAYGDHLLPRLRNALRRDGTAGIPLLEEIADLRHRLAPYDRAHRSLLSNTCVSIGLELWQSESRLEAVRALERAVEVDRHLAASDPGRYRDHLIDGLHMLAARQKAAGLRSEARASRREARRLRWGLGRPAVAHSVR